MATLPKQPRKQRLGKVLPANKECRDCHTVFPLSTVHFGSIKTNLKTGTLYYKSYCRQCESKRCSARIMTKYVPIPKDQQKQRGPPSIFNQPHGKRIKAKATKYLSLGLPVNETAKIIGVSATVLQTAIKKGYISTISAIDTNDAISRIDTINTFGSNPTIEIEDDRSLLDPETQPNSPLSE